MGFKEKVPPLNRGESSDGCVIPLGIIEGQVFSQVCYPLLLAEVERVADL